VDGGAENISYGSLARIVKDCEVLGMPAEVWPLFMDENCGINIPLDKVQDKKEAFRQAFIKLPPEFVESDRWLSRIAGYLQNGELIFMCS
jgi:hypothetical protein